MISFQRKSANNRFKLAATSPLWIGAAFVAESLGIAAWLYYKTGFEFLVLHLLSSLLFFRVSLWASSNYRTRNLWMLSLAFWIFMPPFGFAAGLALLLYFRHGSSGDPKAVLQMVESIDSEEALFRDLSLRVLAEKFGSADQPRALGQSVQLPILDILKSNDSDAKKLAISRLRARKTADSIELLNIAQRDGDYDIRFLATIALSSIEQSWNNDIKELLADIEGRPKNAELRNQIVDAYIQVYRSGLVSDRIAEVYLKQALNHAVVSLQIDPNQSMIMGQIGKIQLFIGNYKQAKEALEKSIRIAPSQTSLRFWKAEAHYRLHEFELLRAECAEILKNSSPHERIRKQIEYWVNVEKEHEHKL